MSDIATRNTEAYLTPVAFTALHEKGIAITPNPEHIARIGDELPDYALPVEATELVVMVRGSTKVNDKRKWLENDLQWESASPDQHFMPSDELQVPDLATARTVTKGAIARAGRYVLTFSAVNTGTWGKERPARFVEQWTARRALSSVAENVPHEVAGAFRDIPIVGAKRQEVDRILSVVTAERLDPFIVTQRRGLIKGKGA